MAATGHLLSVVDLAAIAGRNPSEPRRVPINFLPLGANQIIVPAVPDRFLWCDYLLLVFSFATTLSIQDGAGAVLAGTMQLAGNFPHHFERNIYTEAVNQPIVLVQGGGSDCGGFAIVRDV